MSRHLSRTGHVPLGDGSDLWLLPELGRFVAAYYRPDHTLRAYAFGTLEAMSDLLDVWQAAYDASLITSPAVGDRPGAATIPVPGQTTLGGAA